MEYTPKYLVMVTAIANNNKYYRMIPQGETWIAEYGRIGGSAQRRTYRRSQFESKYHEKLRKGYIDQTELAQDLITQTTNAKQTYRDISDCEIAAIVKRLQDMARAAIEANYTISTNKVTQAMVEEAQSIIDSLLSMSKLADFNSALLSLFTTIPRKMQSVSCYLASSQEDYNKIISREQDLLDVMKGQVVEKQTESASEDICETEKDKTILEAMDLEISRCSNEDIAVIRTALGSCSDRFYNAWHVVNLKTQKRFDQFIKDNNIKDTRLLFHGSRNENWWSIIQSGLQLRPTNAVITGKMFGYGIYYAPKAQKSLGYTSLSGSYWANGNSDSGFMALMSVAYGKPYDVYSFESRYSGLDYEKLQNLCPGANCLHAHKGSMLRNDEIIIYKEAQSTIKYLVELKRPDNGR